MSRYTWRKLTEAEPVIPAVWCASVQAQTNTEQEPEDAFAAPGYADGYAAGLEEGRSEGERQMQAETQHLTELLQAALSGLENLRDVLREEQVAQSVQAMSGLFRVLFGHEMSATLLSHVVETVVPEPSGPIRVSLSPAVLQRVQQSDIAQGIELQSCDSLGDTAIRVEHGELLASLCVPDNLDALLGEFLHSRQQPETGH